MIKKHIKQLIIREMNHASSIRQAERRGKDDAANKRKKMGDLRTRVRETTTASAHGGIQNARARLDASKNRQNPISPFASMLAARVRAAMPTQGERRVLEATSVKVSIACTETDFDALKLKTDKATNREPDRRTWRTVLKTVSFKSASELDYVFGSDWNIAYDGRVVMVAVPPISIKFIQIECLSRKRQWNGRDYTNWQLVHEDRWFDVEVHAGYVQTLWDQQGELQAALRTANPERCLQ